MNDILSKSNITGTVVHKRYSIKSILGQGGFGRVYKAIDLCLDVPVAVKMLFNSSKELVSQFHSEAKFLAQLRHQGLPRVTDYFFEKCKYFLIMDFIEGESLQEIIEKNNPQKDNLIKWIIEVLETLEYVHSKDIIHRDIKPGNIIINKENKAILVDFGIAKKGVLRITAQGARGMFTPFMASPEQCNTSGITTVASDIYSVGATLYYLITKKFPTDAVSRLMGTYLPLPREIDNNISYSLSKIIEKALELDPLDRYQDTATFKNELNRLLKKNKTIQNLTFTNNKNIFKRDIRRK